MLPAVGVAAMGAMGKVSTQNNVGVDLCSLSYWYILAIIIEDNILREKYYLNHIKTDTNTQYHTLQPLSYCTCSKNLWHIRMCAC